MGRASEIMYLLNADHLPSGLERKHLITSFDITDEFKSFRRQYRRERGLQAPKQSPQSTIVSKPIANYASTIAVEPQDGTRDR